MAISKLVFQLGLLTNAKDADNGTVSGIATIVNLCLYLSRLQACFDEFLPDQHGAVISETPRLRNRASILYRKGTDDELSVTRFCRETYDFALYGIVEMRRIRLKNNCQGCFCSACGSTCTKRFKIGRRL
jgi:hypothetical protein